MCDVDPMDLVETIRKGLLVLDPDWIVRFTHHPFGDTFTVTLKGISRDTEGLQ